MRSRAASPAQHRVTGERVPADGLGVPRVQPLGVEAERLVQGDLVVDRGPFLLGPRGVQGHGQPDLGVGIGREGAEFVVVEVVVAGDRPAYLGFRIGDQRAAFDGTEVRAARDAPPDLRVGIGGQQDHDVGRETGVARDHPPVLGTGRSGEDAVHDGPAESVVEQCSGAAVAGPVGQHALHPHRVLVAQPVLRPPPHLVVGVRQQRGPRLRVLPSPQADSPGADLRVRMRGHGAAQREGELAVEGAPRCSGS